MSEQDPNTLAGIQPRDGAWDRMAQAESERMKADLQAQQELAKARAAMHAENGCDVGPAYNGGNEREQMAYAAGVKEAERLTRMQRQGVLNLGPAPVDVAALANAVAVMSQEVEAMARHMGRIDELVRSLLDSKSPFTDDDVAAIKAHVRHPGALEAARLRETIRCALLVARDADGTGNKSVLEAIIGGADAKG